MNNYDEYQFITGFLSKQRYMDIPQIIANKAKKLTVAKGILFNAKDEKILNYLNGWYWNEKMYTKLLKLVDQLSIYGRAVPFLWPGQAGNIHFEVANPLMTSYVAKVSEQEQLASLWVMPENSMNAVYWYVEIRPKQIKIIKYKNDNKIIVGQANSEIQDKLVPVGETILSNKIDILPVREIINFPRTPIMGNSLLLRAYPDCYPVWQLIDDFQDNIQKKRIQRKMVQPRAYGTFDENKIAELRNKGFNSEIADVFVNVASANYNTQAGTNGFEIVNASPNFDQYGLDGDITLKLIFNGAGYDYDKNNDVNYTNKTESMLNNKFDIETTAIKRQLLKEALDPLFNYIVISKFPELWDAENNTWIDGEAPFSWSFMDCDVVNELRKIEYWNARLANGTASRERVICELDQVDRLIAQKHIQEIDEEFKQQAEMFGNDDENMSGINKQGNTQGVDE